jgi:hypothetical protein
MNRLIRFTGLTLAIALSSVALLPSSAAAIPRFCYCEIYCSSGVSVYGQAANRADCSRIFQETCGGSGTWFCPYQ